MCVCVCVCVCVYMCVHVCVPRGQSNAVQQQQQVQLQQQLNILASAPFGDSPLFRTGIAVGGLVYLSNLQWLVILVMLT